VIVLASMAAADAAGAFSPAADLAAGLFMFAMSAVLQEVAFLFFTYRYLVHRRGTNR
jgi:hypothetical protein